MQKTTVYLNDAEVEALRQLAAATGRSQAELIRQAIRQAAAQAPTRRFRSLGKGEGGGESVPRWNPTALYARLLSDSASDPDSNAAAADKRRG
jgi:Ribbon-helix-helix protein, copG family